jgi:hypothetical protein
MPAGRAVGKGAERSEANDPDFPSRDRSEPAEAHANKAGCEAVNEARAIKRGSVRSASETRKH